MSLTSITTTRGATGTVLPEVAVWPFPWLIAIWVGVPAVIATAAETTAFSPELVNARVRSPTVPVIDNPAKVASPLASLFTVAVPPRAPPPLAMATVTARTPGDGVARRVLHLDLRLHGEHAAVRRLLDGWVRMIASFVAIPAPMVITALVSGVNAPDVNRMV